MSDGLRADTPPAQTIGDGLPCAGCGHPIEPTDRLYSIIIRGLLYGFHASCYETWSGGSVNDRGGGVGTD
jgi:hypothetical protein